MDQQLLANLLIITGEGFWVVGSLVQLKKLVKTKDPKGLSATTQVLFSAGNAAWITYFVVNQLWIPAITNTLLIISSICILAYVFRVKEQFIRGIIAILVLSPITSYVIIKYAEESGWLGVAYNAVASLPWLIKVLTSRKLTGISPNSLWVAMFATACVFVYGLLVSSLPLIVGCLFGAFYNSTALVYYYGYGHNGIKTKKLLQNITQIRIT